jgi:nitrogen fixation protein FixH
VIRSTVLAVLAALALIAQGAAWKIEVVPKGDLKAGPAVPVEVTVKDAAGTPVEGANVQLVITMVEMDHGETKVTAHSSGAGVYTAHPKFMMEGKWNIEVRAKKGSQSSSTKQQVDVK